MLIASTSFTKSPVKGSQCQLHHILITAPPEKSQDPRWCFHPKGVSEATTRCVVGVETSSVCGYNCVIFTSSPPAVSCAWLIKAPCSPACRSLTVFRATRGVSLLKRVFTKLRHRFWARLLTSASVSTSFHFNFHIHVAGC